MVNGKSWEESQDYLAFVASSFHFTSVEDKKYVRELLRKHSRGITWTTEELTRIKDLLNRRKNLVTEWEDDLSRARASKGDVSYREFDA